MKYLKTTFLVIFILGVGVGFFGSHLLHRRHHWDMHSEKARAMVVDYVSKELGINDDQRSRVSAIIEDTQKKLSALHERVMPERDTLIKDAIEKIKPELNDQQKIKLDEMYEKLKKHREQRNEDK